MINMLCIFILGINIKFAWLNCFKNPYLTKYKVLSRTLYIKLSRKFDKTRLTFHQLLALMLLTSCRISLLRYKKCPSSLKGSLDYHTWTSCWMNEIASHTILNKINVVIRDERWKNLVLRLLFWSSFVLLFVPMSTSLFS